ncbi:MAG: hypothetical protein AAF497_07245, partial [Planctomycetota bacterium]
MSFPTQVSLLGCVPFSRIAAIIVTVVLSGMLCSAESPEVFELDEPVTKWQLGRQSGNVYAFTKTGLFLFPDKGNGKPTKLKLQGEPVSLAEKPDILVVALRNPESLIVLDLWTKEQSIVTLPTKARFLLMASDELDPWVYCVERVSNPRILRVDVYQSRVDKIHEHRSSIIPKNATLVPNGDYIIFDDRHIHTFDAGNLTLGPMSKPVGRDTKPDPLGRNWLRGNILLDDEFRPTTVKFAGENAIFCPESAAVLSVVKLGGHRDPMLMVESRAGEVISATRLSFPEKIRRSARTVNRNRNRWQDNQLQATADGNRLLIVDKDRAFSVDLTEPRFKLQPKLYFERILHKNVPVLERIVLPVRVLPSDAKQTVVSLDECPEGAVLQDKRLIWNTELTDIGKHRFTLKATNGTQHDLYSFTLDVAPPYIELPGTIDLIRVDDSGKHAAVHNLDLQTLYVIELDKMQIIAQKQLEYPDSLVIRGDKVWYTQSAELKCFDRKTLVETAATKMPDDLDVIAATEREIVLRRFAGFHIWDNKTLNPCVSQSAEATPRGFVNFDDRILIRDDKVVHNNRKYTILPSPKRIRGEMHWKSILSTFRDRELDIYIGSNPSTDAHAISLKGDDDKEIVRLNFEKSYPRWQFHDAKVNRVVYSRGNVLYRYDFRDEILPRLPPRMQITPPTAKLWPMSSTVKFKLAVKHARGNLTFSVPQSKFVSIDSKGELTIQARAMWDHSRSKRVELDGDSGETQYSVFRKANSARQLSPLKTTVITRIHVAATTSIGQTAFKTFDVEFCVDNSDLSIDESPLAEARNVNEESVARRPDENG